MKVVCIIQARMGSTRLPGKVLADVEGRPLIGRMLERVGRSRRIDELWVATTRTSPDDDLVAYLASSDVHVHRGDEHDVLGRYAEVVRKVDAQAIVRLTADCPLVDPEVIDETITRFLDVGCDYASNCMDRTYPDGLDCEVIKPEALLFANEHARDALSREHVTPYIRKSRERPSGKPRFRREQVKFVADFSHLRWTVDYREDLELIREVFKRLLPSNPYFKWLDVVALQTRHRDLLTINASVGD